VTKVTLSVCKAYKNSGSLRFHRKKTRKHWKRYFIDDETGKWQFGTEWVNPITAQFLKTKIHHKVIFICSNCARRFEAYVKNSREKVYCPVCPDEE